jgi:hypothetical protein
MSDVAISVTRLKLVGFVPLDLYEVLGAETSQKQYRNWQSM